MTSKRKIRLGVWAMGMAMIGDYLLGVDSIGAGGGPDALYGMTWNAVGDWRLALSSLLGFACVPLFAVAALELMRVMESRHRLGGDRFYRLFRVANWAGILHFAFMHVGICMLPVVFNAGFDATGDKLIAANMAIRVAKSIAAPLAISFVAADVLATVGWIGLVAGGKLPLKKWLLICNPVMIALIGQLANLLPLPFAGADSGFESLGWLVMYWICAEKL